jgi:hypothetical protein
VIIRSSSSSISEQLAESKFSSLFSGCFGSFVQSLASSGAVRIINGVATYQREISKNCLSSFDKYGKLVVINPSSIFAFWKDI